MTYLQGECPHRRAEEDFVDSTSVECLFSITPLPGLSAVSPSGDSVKGESLFFDESLMRRSFAESTPPPFVLGASLGGGGGGVPLGPTSSLTSSISVAGASQNGH